jgi:hypothetical protein
MSDDTKKTGGTTAPTEVKGPQGRGAPPKPEGAPQVQTSLDPARTGVVDRKVEGAGAPVTSRPMPAEAAEKLDKAAAIRADIGKSKEQLEADKLEREANDAIARQAAEDAEARGGIKGTTVAEAKMAAAPLVGSDVLASDHFAQKFGNDPRNPKLAPGLNPAEATVLLSRKTPDHPDLVYAMVNPEMVGDYERAGWNRAA